MEGVMLNAFYKGKYFCTSLLDTSGEDKNDRRNFFGQWKNLL